VGVAEEREAAMETGGGDVESLVEVALPAVRAIVAVAVRSLEASPVPVTLAQYRMLVTMDQQGPTRAATLATLLDVDASTVTRMCDRLVRDGLIARRAERADRRAVRVALTAAGSDVVSAVAERRRQEFGALLEAIPAERRTGVVVALQELDAASRAITVDPPAFGWIA
jgi:DNA-binding MarR family transcriptional regulator